MAERASLFIVYYRGDDALFNIDPRVIGDVSWAKMEVALDKDNDIYTLSRNLADMLLEQLHKGGKI